MSEKTMGVINSTPNDKGEHSLKCPQCSAAFLSTITQNDTDGSMQDITCNSCRYVAEPKVFIVAAHQQEVNDIAMGYVQKELKKSLGKWLR